MDLRGQLAQVVASAAPAQSERAQQLFNALDSGPWDDATEAAARELIDAYLHDPYLTKGY
ncbi:MAG: hypothetical protein CMN22_02320 [Rubrivirga sp.]|jgi:hypothetical protein|nr:hypothetical protein [Rubrivirga sp.]|tara:strand:+ start:439 stop:618 length:180 start_codon:yes stop_codon:yes gene_type:complete